MASIFVSVTNDLVIDQRVHRVCETLQSQGNKVMLVGRKRPGSQDVERKYKTRRLRLLFQHGFLFYAFFNIRLFFFLLFRKMDVLLANDLDTLLANYLVSRIKKKKLVFDSHEYFPEVPELVDRPFVKNFWLRIERGIIPNLEFCYTVSPSIADLYTKKYHVPFQVIRNVPYTIQESQKTSEKFQRKTIIYQGALNVGRGLEMLIEAMKYLPAYDVKIIGDGDIAKRLHEKVDHENLNDQVEFYGKVSLNQLIEITQQAHLGVSLEEDLGLNYRFALPNKLFDYIQAGIPVLVSDLPEMRKMVQQYEVGEMVQERTAEAIADKIRTILSDQVIYETYRKNALKAGRELCWENEEQKLITLFNEVVKK